MKKGIIVLIFAVLFIWGIAALIGKGNDDLKNVGDVRIAYGGVTLDLEGTKIEKRYEDDIKTFEEPVLSEIADDLTAIKKPEKAAEGEEQIEVAVCYEGDFIDGEDEIIYSIYNGDYELLSTTKTLDMSLFEEEVYYVGVDVKWGLVKNYVKLRYFFKIIV